jgi:hypothetical protein
LNTYKQRHTWQLKMIVEKSIEDEEENGGLVYTAEP